MCTVVWARRAVGRGALCVLALLLAAPDPARAQDITLPPVVVGADSVVVLAGVPGSLAVVSGPGVGGGGPVIRCVWHELVFSSDGVPSSRPATPVAGEAFVIWCVDPDGSVVDGYPRLVLYDPADPVPGAAVSSHDAARFALARIDFEPPRPALSPPGRQIVGVATWLGVTSRLGYDDITARAGPVWATVRPVLRDVTWDMGDGVTVVCTSDVATVWRVGLGSDDQSTDCTHVHTRSSDGTHQPAAVTVTWTVLWRSDRDPTGWRVFDTLSIRSAFAVEIADLQAAIR